MICDKSKRSTLLKKHTIMKVIITCIALLLLTTTLHSQSISNYSTSRSSSITYNSISGTGNSVSAWRNTGQYSQDDNRSFAIDIGFDFWYNGVRYTQFNVSTNGFIDFSTSTSNGTGTGAYGYSNTRFSNTTPTGLSLAPLYDDMTAQGGAEALGNSIKYLTSGNSPNRVLTVEWINMAVYGNTSPDLNFQVKLYETTGVIEFIYGTITPGNVNYSYSLGINAGTISNPPTAAQLLMQQTANSNSFSNSASNSLSTLPSSNTKITFTPPTHTGTYNGNVTFSNVTASSITVNYSNWCTNEIGYAIYNSVNNIDFDFIALNASNSTSYVASGLLPNTTYYWKIIAVTEGKLSTSATGNQATAAAGTKTSNVSSGNWNSNGSWTPSGVPTSTDNVIIKDGHTITINANAQCNNLTVGQGSSGTLRIGNSSTSRNLTINGDLLINNGGSLIAGNTNATHTINFSGDITNNGTLNLRPTSSRLVNATFNKNGNQLISGSGSTTSFNTIVQNMGTVISNVLDITATNFTAPDNFLTLTNGTFKLGSTNSLNINLFSSDVTFSASNGFYLNNPNAIINFNGNLILNGSLYVQNGTVNIGNAADEYIESKGGEINISGGTLTIAGNYFSTDINTLSNFSISNGTLIVPSIGSTSTTNYPFHIQATGSSFNMTGGTIIIPREGGDGSQDLGMYIDGLAINTITNGSIQFGNSTSPTNQNYNLFTSSALPNLIVYDANATLTMLNNIELYNDLQINGGTFNTNGFDLSVKGNWTNSGNFIEGVRTVTFNGNGTQTINTIGGENFYNFTVAKNSGSVGFGTDSLRIRGTLDVQQGTINTNNKLVLLSDAIGTARVAAIDQGVISGDIIAQRFMPGGSNKRRWRYMSSPINVGGLVSLSQFIDDIYVTGIGGASNGFDESPNNLSSIRHYDETLDGNADNGWVDPASISTTYSTGTGFEVFGRGSRATQNPFDVNSIPLDATIDLIGSINRGNITKNLSYTNHSISSADGFNLVGNPYPSAIDFNSPNITKTNMLNAFWVYNPNTGSYGVFDAELNSGTNGINRYISSGQGFFVKAISSGASITFTENSKTSNEPFTYFRSNDHSISGNILRMNVSKDSLYEDELIIALRENASKLNTDNSDLGKFFNDQINFYSKSSNNFNLAINEYPIPSTVDTINLSLFSYDNGLPWEGTYTISCTLDDISKNLEILLWDTFTDKITNLEQENNYTFQLTNNSNSFGNDRFKLIIKSVKTFIRNDSFDKSSIFIYPNPSQNNITVRFNTKISESIGNVNIYTISGQLVYSANVEIQNDMINIHVEGLDSGIYILEIENKSRVYRNKFTRE